MTTRVLIKNEDDSNPEQELVVANYNVSGGQPLTVLGAGEKQEFWVSSGSVLQIVERKKS